MKLTIVKKFTFDSAHFIPNHDGKCINMHGHTYLLEIGVTNENKDMIMDFSQLSTTVKHHVVNLLDHKIINEIISYPTAERMVRWIHDQLAEPLAFLGANLCYIQLHETPSSYCVWRLKDENM